MMCMNIIENSLAVLNGGRLLDVATQEGGFVQVLYYGFFSPGLRAFLASLHTQLDGFQPYQPSVDGDPQTMDRSTGHLLCPSCGQVMQ